MIAVMRNAVAAFSMIRTIISAGAGPFVVACAHNFPLSFFLAQRRQIDAVESAYLLFLLYQI